MTLLNKRRVCTESMAGALSGRGIALQSSSSRKYASKTKTVTYPQASITASAHRNPRPSNALTEEEQLRATMKKSKVNEQKDSKEMRRLQKMEAKDVKRAMNLSEIDQHICENKAEEEEELLLQACEQSFAAEEQRQQLTEQQYAVELEMALQQSSHYEESNQLSEEDLIEQAIQESMNAIITPEQELLQQAMAASLAEERERMLLQGTNMTVDDILKQSIAEEVERKASEVSCPEEDLLRQAMAASLAEEHGRLVLQGMNVIEEEKLEHSIAKEDNKKASKAFSSEEDLIRQAMAESLTEEHGRTVLQGTNIVEEDILEQPIVKEQERKAFKKISSEEDLSRQAMVLSLAEERGRQVLQGTNIIEEDVLEQERETLEEVESFEIQESKEYREVRFQGIDILAEVMRLSMEENE